MNKAQINLARKWRSKQFDEIIGQPLVVRLIKNSLYKGLIFPVYLFSGTRGCGKTSTARLFAAALNCARLEDFQKNPQLHKLPCLLCDSCSFMQKLQHPDFIEIDAASHTGVDNIRQIIDAASFVPSFGKKKIYLIDEAHMLSKAAFNALLKILEEPPLSVVFMLATTDESKIIETVRSRCFQLYFYPIAPEQLTQHLVALCTEESIAYEYDALLLVAQETEGSVRDAINVIERIRLICSTITKQVVYETLGFVDEERLFCLIKELLLGSCSDVLQFWKSLKPERLSAHVFWKKLIDVIRLALFVKNNVKPEQKNKTYAIQLADIATNAMLIKIFEIACSYELQLAKAANPVLVLELMLIKIWQELSRQAASGDSVDPVIKQPVQQVKVIQPENSQAVWQRCLKEIVMTDDPLVVSVFKQGTFVSGDQQKVTLMFGKNLLFFSEWLTRTKDVWQPILVKYFGAGVQLNAEFTQVESAAQQMPAKAQDLIISPATKTGQSPVVQKTGIFSKPIKEKERILHITDNNTWPKAHTVLKIFPGTVSYIEGQYE